LVDKCFCQEKDKTGFLVVSSHLFRSFKFNARGNNYRSLLITLMSTPRLLFFISVFLLALPSRAQKDTSLYDDPSDVSAGDVLFLNDPSDPNYYRSIYFTFKAAKIVYPEVNADKYEKVYLSYKFAKTPFTVHKIKKGIAILSYGMIKNFAVIDLNLGFKSGEIGNRENISMTWLADKVKAGDSLKLLVPNNTDSYENVTSPSGGRLSAKFEGSTFHVYKVKTGKATMGNESIQDFAIVKLSEALDVNEIEVRENVTLVEESESRLDRITDSRPDNTVFGKLRIEPYLFPMLEVSGVDGSPTFVIGAGAGIIFRDKFQFGGFFHKSNRNHMGVFDYDSRLSVGFNFDYTYSGFYVGYQVFQKGSTRFLAELKVGVGEAQWDEENRQNFIENNTFTVVNPRFGIDFPLNKLLILNLMLGYRSTSDVQMTDLDATPLNGITFSAALKFGRFR